VGTCDWEGQPEASVWPICGGDIGQIARTVSTPSGIIHSFDNKVGQFGAPIAMVCLLPRHQRGWCVVLVTPVFRWDQHAVGDVVTGATGVRGLVQESLERKGTPGDRHNRALRENVR